MSYNVSHPLRDRGLAVTLSRIGRVRGVLNTGGGQDGKSRKVSSSSSEIPSSILVL